MTPGQRMALEVAGARLATAIANLDEAAIVEQARGIVEMGLVWAIPVEPEALTDGAAAEGTHIADLLEDLKVSPKLPDEP